MTSPTPPARERTPAERFKAATIIRYEHGGGRVYVDSSEGGRELIADLYREDMREYVIAACNSRDALVAALEAIKAKCAAPALEHDQRDAVHFAYNTSDAALRAARGDGNE